MFGFMCAERTAHGGKGLQEEREAFEAGLPLSPPTFPSPPSLHLCSLSLSCRQLVASVFPDPLCLLHVWFYTPSIFVS